MKITFKTVTYLMALTLLASCGQNFDSIDTLIESNHAPPNAQASSNGGTTTGTPVLGNAFFVGLDFKVTQGSSPIGQLDLCLTGFRLERDDQVFYDSSLEEPILVQIGSFSGFELLFPQIEVYEGNYKSLSFLISNACQAGYSLSAENNSQDIASRFEISGEHKLRFLGDFSLDSSFVEAGVPLQLNITNFRRTMEGATSEQEFAEIFATETASLRVPN